MADGKIDALAFGPPALTEFHALQIQRQLPS